MQLVFSVKEQTVVAVPTNSIPRRGSREYLSLRFEFAEDWARYEKTIYFQTETDSVPYLLRGETENEINVPTFCTELAGFYFTLVGIDGEERCPTNIMTVVLDEAGGAWETVPPDTDIPAYQQLVMLAQEAAKSAEEAHAAVNEIAKAPVLPIARCVDYELGNGDEYYRAYGVVLPEVIAGNSPAHVGKGSQIVFIPYDENQTESPQLSLNDGHWVPIRLRADRNQRDNEQAPDATLPVPVGTLMRGVPYTLTFCGRFWLVDSYIKRTIASSDIGDFSDAVCDVVEDLGYAKNADVNTLIDSVNEVLAGLVNAPVAVSENTEVSVDGTA